jgi:hypothetical protein
LIDAHAHVVESGASLSTLNLVGAPPAVEIAEMVKHDVYTYEYKFCVRDTAGARLYLQMLVDDDAVVYLNSNPIGQTPPNPSTCS